MCRLFYHGKLAIAILGSNVACVVAAGSAFGATETVVYNFGPADTKSPSVPLGKLTLDSSGNIYGTTEFGGAHKTGTIYELTPAGQLTILHDQSGNNQNPQAGVTRDARGNLFGSAYGSVYVDYPGGSVFKLHPDGKFDRTEFNGYGHGPAAPQSAPVFGRRGAYLYGTGFGGGASFDLGTLFQVAPDLTVTVLRAFGPADPAGWYPGVGDLAVDAQGNLYGATTAGGIGGEGTLFKVSPSGQETVLYNGYGFSIDTGACLRPNAGLIFDNDGNLYGTAFGFTGPSSSYGCIFELTASGNFLLLYSDGFSAGGAGFNPGLVRTKGGTLYGTTQGGGTYNKGSVFKLEPDGTFTTIYSFTGGADGGTPGYGLTMDPQGSLYGAAGSGGTLGGGVVYKIKLR